MQIKTKVMHEIKLCCKKKKAARGGLGNCLGRRIIYWLSHPSRLLITWEKNSSAASN